MADARILMHMTDRPDIAELIADDVAVVKQILAVSQLVARKLQSEKRYLARLEGQLNDVIVPHFLHMPDCAKSDCRVTVTHATLCQARSLANECIALGHLETTCHLHTNDCLPLPCRSERLRCLGQGLNKEDCGSVQTAGSLAKHSKGAGCVTGQQRSAATYSEQPDQSGALDPQEYYCEGCAQ